MQPDFRQPMTAEAWLTGNNSAGMERSFALSGRNGTTVWQQIAEQLTTRNMAFAAVAALALCLLLACLCLLRVCCLYRKWRTACHKTDDATSRGELCYQTANTSKRGIFTRMIATLDEFDSLTPLIVTPGSLADEDALARTAGPSRQSTVSTTATPSVGMASSHSPPPPRRAPPGRTLVVPLTAAARGRQPVAIEVERSYEMTMTASSTAKSICTIPEVAEESASTLVQPSASAHSLSTHQRPTLHSDVDIISIDRTSGSTLERMRDRARHTAVVQPMVAASVALPLHASPPVPLSAVPDDAAPAKDYPLSPESIDSPSTVIGRRDVLEKPPAADQSAPPPLGQSAQSAPPPLGQSAGGARPSASGDSLSSTLSSPMESSAGESGSPLDTSGSIADISDSFYMASESDNAAAAAAAESSLPRAPGRTYILDTGMQKTYRNNNESAARCSSAAAAAAADDSDEGDECDASWRAGTRYQLHRIDEESELDDGAAAQATALLPTTTSRTDDSLSALSKDATAAVDSECNLLDRHNPAAHSAST